MPGGGLSPDATRWIAGSQTFFLPVKPLAKLFRRLFLEQLQASFEAGKLKFFNDLATLADPAAFKVQITAMRRINLGVIRDKVNREWFFVFRAGDSRGLGIVV